MTKKILYFLAGGTATPEELADIDTINAMCEPAFELNVLNGSVDPNLGMTPNPDEDPEPGDPANVPLLKECDYVAGAIPSAYDEVDEFNPDDPPAPELPSTSGIVTDGQTMAVSGGTITFAVSENVVTATFAAE